LWHPVRVLSNALHVLFVAMQQIRDLPPLAAAMAPARFAQGAVVRRA
jgi:hypothetical protein